MNLKNVAHSFGLSMFTVLIMLAAPVFFSEKAAASEPNLTTLEPGGFRNIEQNLPINIVFIGYEPGSGARQINQAAFQAELANTYRAMNRLPSIYGIRSYPGVTFNYDYNFVYADAAFEDAFFGYLSSIAVPKRRTVWQNRYNAQNSNSLNVGQNHWIEAASVERWLANNASTSLNLNAEEYTVFFINWYGRSDFKFHVYVKTNEPDPDTGVNHGLNHDNLKNIAWGGSTPDDEETGLGSLRRIWFYDLSAGPELWTDNWNVDHADITGDGVMDYRMPPVWEYGNAAGYRPFNNLSGDLGKITRYVALNLLFTTSPIYKPAISPPKLPTDIQMDVNLYQGDPTVNIRDFFNPALFTREISELQPLNNFSTEVTDQSLTGRASDVYDCFYSAFVPPYDYQSCYGNRLRYGDIFLYHRDQEMQFLEGDGDYEIPIYLYNTTSERALLSLSGFADDNWVDGTQSYVFMFSDPISRDFLGTTFVGIHEVGHHLGLSHPHDGYDYERDIDYSFHDGEFYFAYSGDQSSTAMSYILFNKDFSQFDRDNMNRFLTATYLNQSNAVLPLILSSPRAAEVTSLLESADQSATNALSAYGNMNYLTASGHSKAAYQKVLTAAATINVQIEPQAWQADYRAKGLSPKFVDSIANYRLNLP